MPPLVLIVVWLGSNGALMIKSVKKHFFKIKSKSLILVKR